MNNGDFVDTMLDRIKLRAKEVHTDVMWFIIALKIRYENLPWSEMEKYAEVEPTRCNGAHKNNNEYQQCAFCD